MVSESNGLGRGAGVVFNWELCHGVYAPIKILPPTIVFDPDEVPVAPNLMEGFIARGCYRTAAYRQLQGVFSMGCDVTENTMDTYRVPLGYYINN